MPSYEHCCKVGRVADKHDLSSPVLDQDINQALLARWLGRAEFPETSTRGLVKWFNLHIIKSVYVEHGRSAREYQLENDYEALTADDEDDHQKWSVKNSLEEDGIDPDELTSDFISTSTMYRHLTNCLEGKKERKKAETDWEETKIKFAKEKAVNQIQDALRSLDNKGELLGAKHADVEVEIYLNCPDCSTSVPFTIAHQRGYVCEEHKGVGDGNNDSKNTETNTPSNP